MIAKAFRCIALIDLDAFFAAVEVLEQPELAGKPVLVGGSPTGRGVVAAASYEARVYGCRSAMPMAQALRLCPEAVVLPTRHGLYREYSQRAMAVLQAEGAPVEQMSIDEAYVDLTAVCDGWEQAEAKAHRMQARLRIDVGLSASVGLAPNKLVAKVACETAKPGGFAVVWAGQETTFLAPLAIDRLPGIGPSTAARLKASGFSTLGQLAEATTSQVISTLGPRGVFLQQRAKGVDASPVRQRHQAKSVSAEETFAQDVDEAEALNGALAGLVDDVASSLAKHQLVGRTVTLKLRFADFRTITRSASFDSATASRERILTIARELLAANWEPGWPLRLAGVGVSNLRTTTEEGQLRLEALS